MIARASLVLTPSDVRATATKTAWVAIDVFRATSVIATALANGARSVVAASTPEEAIAAAARLGPQTILGGERNSVRIEGFALGNSPAEYSAQAVDGKTIVITTTNGTLAIAAVRTHDPMPALTCGALLNASAVAASLDASGLSDTVLVCGGSEGEVSMEDVVAAGAIVARLSGWSRGAVAADDLVRSAVALHEAHRGDLYALLSRGKHAQHLIEKGFGADVRSCSRADVLDAVPCWDGTAFRLRSS